MTEQERRMGRPVKAVPAGQRASLGLKVTSEIKQRLDAAARANGRTQSQEAEVRLEQSFRDEKLLPQILDLAHGEQTAGLLMLLARCIDEVSSQAGFAERLAIGDAETWMGRPWVYHQVETAIRRVLDVLRPSEDPIPPEMLSIEDLSDEARAERAAPGLTISDTILSATVDPDFHHSLSPSMQAVRERLIDVIEDLKRKHHAR